MGWVSNKKIKLAINRGPALYCKFYSQNKCRDASKCKHIHKCNVILPNSKVCHMNHSAADHTGKVTEA